MRCTSPFNTLDDDGGRFVLANCDPTGYGLMATSWLGQQHTIVRSEDVHYRLWRHQGLSGVPERRTLQRGR